ncbi:MAG TPA: hypothetical protein VLM91_01160 [Candidatus Methylomirabilis sp.]|nr:hypothetical protein [Candidatus Methylomirabilis sp.]
MRHAGDFLRNGDPDRAEEELAMNREVSARIIWPFILRVPAAALFPRPMG